MSEARIKAKAFGTDNSLYPGRRLWERGYVLSLNDVTILDISSFMNERYYFKLFKEFLDTCDEKRRMESASSFTERKQNMTNLSSKALTVNYALAVHNDRKKFREETKALKIHRGPILAV